MGSGLTFQYPAWFILLCLLLGAVYALVLYFRNSYLQDPTAAQKRGFIALGVVRFVVVSVLAILLLSPFFRTRITDKQQPSVVILQDNSESVKNKLDSAEYIQNLNQLAEGLKEDFQVDRYVFSDVLDPEGDISFSGKATNMSDPLSQLLSLYGSQNVGALILAGDGIYNQGANPLYAVGKGNFPIYTVAMGDTTPQKDLRVDDVLYNRIVYLNDRFKIGVDVASLDMPDATTQLQVWDYTNESDPEKLKETAVTFEQANDYLSEDFILEADEVGVKHYRIALAPVDGEFSETNNYKDIFIEVLDGRQKILVAAHAPHPDISALKQAVANNKNYELQVVYPNDLGEVNAEEYNLCILHQLPSKKYNPQNFFTELKEAKIPTWYILGAQSSLPAFNQLQSSLQLNQSGANIDDAAGVVNTDFTLFTLPENLSTQLQQFPPVSVPFGEYKTSPGADILLSQRIGAVNTDKPLFLFDEVLGRKTAVFVGDGLWRWRLYNYLSVKDHALFNSLINKTIQYLAVKEDKRPFRVMMAKNIFYENENIVLEAELYNESYEPVNTPDVELTITDEAGKEYPFVFDKRGNSYQLNVGNLPVGSYNFTATTQLDDETYSYQGKFTVIPTQLEAFTSVADHNLLYQMSEETGGALYYPDQMGELQEAILNSDASKPVLYETFATRSLLDYKCILFLLVGLLALEWFVRKFQGGY